MHSTPIPIPSSTDQQTLGSAALAAVVQQLFPSAALAGGGVNSLGFYYDFVFETPITGDMLEFIEVQLLRFIKEGHEVRFLSMMRENAESFFEHHGQDLLADLAARQKANILEIVQIGSFHDICREVPLSSLQEIGRIKLLEVSQIVRIEGDEELNLSRISGVARADSRELKIFCKTYDSFLKKQDHRILGPKLNLFSFSERAGELGLFWHSKGLQLKEFLIQWQQSQMGEGEPRISTPIVTKDHQISGEIEGLKPFDFDGAEYRLRSSFLRSHLELFRMQLSSGQPSLCDELPWVAVEWGPVFRESAESQRWGLLNNCAYVGESATICCPKSQVIPQLISYLHLIEQIITIFCFEAQWCLKASRHEKAIGQREMEAVLLLKKVWFSSSGKYPLNEQIDEDTGDGPSLELSVRDSLGRLWPMSRLSVIQPAIWAKTSPLHDREGKSLVVLTRSVCVSLDRLIALLIERHHGVLPFWLTPEQVRVISLGEADKPCAAQIVQSMRMKGIRAQLDVRSAKLSARIHEAERENVPYLVLIGEQERMKRKLTVRSTERRGQKQSVEDVEAFLNKLHQESICPILKKEL